MNKYFISESTDILLDVNILRTTIYIITYIKLVYISIEIADIFLVQLRMGATFGGTFLYRIFTTQIFGRVKH